MSYINLEMQF